MNHLCNVCHNNTKLKISYESRTRFVFFICCALVLANFTQKLQCYFTAIAVFDPMINILRQRQNGRHIADNIFKYIFLNAYA